MNQRDGNSATNGARIGDRRGGERRLRNERRDSRRMIDCGGVADGWPATPARSASAERASASDRSPHGAGVYPDQQQAI
jgi:hypothetical protein